MHQQQPFSLEAQGRGAPLVVDFFAPGLPQTKGSAKAFGFQRADGSVGANIVNDNPKAKAWAGVIALAAREAMQGRPAIATAVRVDITFCVPRPKAHFRANGTLRPDAPRFAAKKPDGDKYERCAWDALTGVVFVDDALVVKWAGEKLYAADGRIGALFHIEEVR